MDKHQEKNEIYNVIGIGIGPFNLGMACLLEPLTQVKALFIDEKPNFNWHPGLLIENTTLQIPFIADLVSFADPTNPYSFLNYLKETGSIYSFYIREDFYILRNQYNKYCQWATQKLKNLAFSKKVVSIVYDDLKLCYELEVQNTKTQKTETYKAKKIILGTGTQAYIPDFLKPLKNRALHSGDYLNRKKDLQKNKIITILGSGQSAAEVYYDLLQEIDIHGYQLNWITRSDHFFQMEYNKLTLELTSPEYIDYFYKLPNQTRENRLKCQTALYKGISESLINDIFDLIYQKKVTHSIDTNLLTNSICIGFEFIDNENLLLKLHHKEQKTDFDFKTQGLVLATGYCYQTPGFLKPIADRINWDESGMPLASRNYSIDKNKTEVFVQNAELKTHGFVTPDLGMGCYRNTYIINQIVKNSPYVLEDRIAFQRFGAYSNITNDQKQKTSSF